LVIGKMQVDASMGRLSRADMGGNWPMPTPPLQSPVDDAAPEGEALTDYDRAHLITYLRLLDAEADGADWREVATIVLGRSPTDEAQRSEACWRSHLARARWMSAAGYRRLLDDARANAIVKKS
jgi:hypothetical protein